MLSKGSFEDFLYILVGIVWVAFSLYKGSKKSKKEAVGSGQKTSEQKGFLETLFDEFSEQDKQQADPAPANDILSAETTFPSEVVSNEKIFSYDNVYEEKNFTNSETVLEEIETPGKSDPLDVQMPQKKKLRFDLKKAIIYSEILQPKYF